MNDIRVIPHFCWQDAPNTSLKNLQILLARGIAVGFIEKPNDAATEKNAWRGYIGIGDKARFIGHRRTERAARSEVKNFYRGSPGYITGKNS